MEPFLGQIMLVPYDFAPLGWAFCDGQLLPIAQHTALFSLLGNAYGGDGRHTFALPDLRGRVPVHAGGSQAIGVSRYKIGQTGGAEEIYLEPHHLSAVVRQAKAGSDAQDPHALSYGHESRPLDLRQPYVALNYIIALQGVYPGRG